jgi:T4 RnlA family RNA ligase
VKINLSEIDKTQFKVKEGVVAGEPVFLVCPQKIGCDWTRENLHFRSSMWDKNGNLISAGFKKFFNVGEKPGLGEFDKDEKLTAVTKMDGSCIIVSKFKDELIIRTRETISVRIHETFQEVEDLVYKKYPKIVEHLNTLPEYSLVFENTTPSNQIVLNYPKPDLTLLGVIEHENYSYLTQGMVDRVAKMLGVPRPGYHNFENFEDLFQRTKTEKSIEGWCIYYGYDQEIRKLKTDFYLACHRLNFGMSKDKILDIVLAAKAEDEKTLKKRLSDEYDYEVLSMANFSHAIEAYRYALEVEKKVRAVTETLGGLNRKEQAGEVYRQLPKELVGYAFILLDGRDFDDKIKKKIMSNYEGD